MIRNLSSVICHLSCLLLSALFFLPLPLRASDLDLALRVIRLAESDGRARVPDGDGGRAVGPYQHHRIYVEHVNRMWGRAYVWPRDSRNPEIAREITRLYLLGVAGPGATLQKYCRIHNGGPRGARNPATLRYWRTRCAPAVAVCRRGATRRDSGGPD